MTHTPSTFKISIVGAGNVGATAAYAMLLEGLATDLTLIDVARERAEGVVTDLTHSLAFTAYTKLIGTDDPHAAKDSDIIFITAGTRQKPGQTRLDLISTNKKIVDEIIPPLAHVAPGAIIVLVTNPVDVLTHEALKRSGFPKERVFGSGTILDTARLRFHLSEALAVHPSSIHAMVLGEHGDTSFPVWSSAAVSGKSIFEFDGFGQKIADECYEKTRTAAYRIVHDVGYTCYSIATAMLEIAKSIREDSHRVLMLSTMLEDYYGHSDVCVSIPCVLARGGIVKTLTVPLSKAEQDKLALSVTTLKKVQ